MSTILDHLRDASVSREADGYRATRTALVTELSGTPEARIAAALSAPGLPPFASPHPALPGAVVTKITATLIDIDQAEVTIEYGPPSEASREATDASGVLEYDIDAAVAVERTNRDGAGRLVTNIYTGPNPAVAGGYVTWIEEVEMEVARPQIVVRIAKRVTANPLALCLRYTGSTNADAWSSYPPRTWIAALRAERDADAWRLTYELTYNPDTWVRRHIVSVYGFVPDQAVLGNGILDVLPYREEIWASLGVTL